MKKYYYAVGLALSGMLLGSCSNDENTPNPDPEPVAEARPLQVTAKERSIVEKSNGLAPVLLSAILEKTPKTDVVVSPLSAEIYFSMLANAAEGESRDKILEFLGADDIEALNSLNARYMEELPLVDPSKASVIMANNVWYNSDRSVVSTPDFSETLSTYYGAEHISLPLTSDAGKSTLAINGWISDKTSGLINHLYNDLEISGSLVIMANAMHFKAEWKEKFKAAETRLADFHDASGNVIGQVPMMSGTMSGDFSLDETGYRLVIPFGQGAYQMEIKLPLDGVSLSEAAEELAKYPSFPCGGAKIILKMPRFTTDYEYRIEEVMSTLSIEDAVLSKITSEVHPDGIKKSSILTRQRANITVDEDGAVAAVVTATQGITSPGVLEVTLDRPFVYMIREVSSGAILFMGAKCTAN